MKRSISGWTTLAVLFAGSWHFAGEAHAQGVLVPRQPSPVPGSYTVQAVEVDARVKDQIASVQVRQTFANPTSTPMEVQLVFPLPYDGAIDQMTLLVDGREFPARLLKRDEARRFYEEIVRRRRDPALLEYLGRGAFQTSVFPLPPQGERQVTLRYTQLCRKDGHLVDFLYPLATMKHSARPIETLRITIRIETTAPLKSIYSPTHELDIQRPDDRHAVCTLQQSDVVPTEDLRLLYDVAEGPVGVSLLSYRPTGEDGFFLLLASPEIDGTDGPPPTKTVVFVLDRSGSMSGEKIEQAKGALRFVLNRLRPGDTFNVVAYDSEVESFRPEIQRWNDTTQQEALAFVDGLYAGGGTNIDAALQTALRMLTDRSRPSYVIFLTDGLPTAGETREMAIVEHAREANAVHARLFAFGVGYDVNSRLLDRLTRDLYGQSEYVRPNEDIEARVSGFYAKIGTPVMTNVKVEFEYDQSPGSPQPPPIYLTLPRELPDLFRGQQLVWAGRYRRSGAVKVVISGRVGDEPGRLAFPAQLANESRDDTYGFVAKLWAMRRIGDIIDELDLKGQNQELIDELVSLSLQHGILTQYTAFLADERRDLGVTAANRSEASDRLELLSRTAGESAFFQREQKSQLQHARRVPASSSPARGGAGGSGGFFGGRTLAGAVAYQDAEGQEVPVETVRVIGQKTFFLRKDRWYDSTLTKDQEEKVTVVKQFSDEYFELANRHGAAWAKYLALSDPVVLNIDGQAYLIEP